MFKKIKKLYQRLCDIERTTKCIKSDLEDLQVEFDKLMRIVNFSKDGEITYHSCNHGLYNDKRTYFYKDKKEYEVDGIYLNNGAKIQPVENDIYWMETYEVENYVGNRIETYIVNLSTMKCMLKSVVNVKDEGGDKE